MTVVLMDQVVRTDYGQFDLVWAEGGGFDGDWERVFAGQTNGLVGAAHPDGVYINLGRRSGGSSVVILLSEETPSLDDESWEDIVEVSVRIPVGGNPQWRSWAGEEWGPLQLPPGTYRLRVNARGRDVGSENELADAVVDFYELQFWPTPMQPDAIIRQTSDDARGWHRFNGGRPSGVIP